MEVIFQLDEAVAPINPLPNFTFSLQNNGFTITVPAGYTATVKVLPHAAAGEETNQVHEVDNNELHDDGVNVDAHVDENVPGNFTAQIFQASATRKLSQSEVLYLLQNDSIEIGNEFAKKPTEGLLMYPMAYRNRRDGHKYDGNHETNELEIGSEGVLIKYRRSLVENPDMNLQVTARRYNLLQEGADKFLVHYLQGQEHVNDPEDVMIPVQPELQLA